MKTLVKLLYCSGSEEALWYTLAYSDWYRTVALRSLGLNLIMPDNKAKLYLYRLMYIGKFNPE